MLPAQVLTRVDVRVVQQCGDLLEAEAEPAVQQHLLQPVHVVQVVDPVARRGAAGRGQQPDPVVVVQGAHRDPGEGRQLTHRVAQESPS